MEETDVLIVGAGLAGLSTAVFLRLHGVSALVIDRHESTSILPKARGQNPITMEALRVAGITEAIRAARPPGRPDITSVISESMAGRVLYDHIAHRPDFSRFSPERPGMASQAKTEEALLQRALELGVELRFKTRCESLSQNDDGVDLTLRSLANDALYQVHARYVVACDGVRGTLASQVGIGNHGLGHLKSVEAVQFVADLSKLAGDNSMVVHYVQNPELPDGAGVLVSTDYPGQWVANMSADPERDEAGTAAVIRTLVGLPDVQFKIIGSTTYHYMHRLADRFRAGRVFLAGDAAHVMPPTGGQGGNAAVQDGYYLGWKLAAVVRGQAGAALLDSYDAERRPYAEAVCTWQVANLADRRSMPSIAEKVGEPMDHATMMFGYVCQEGAFIREDGADDARFEHPDAASGRPGSRVPYVQLNGPDGIVSPRLLLGPHFLVFTAAPQGVSIAQAAARELGVELNAHAVASTAPLGAGANDTVLVRPDGVVAWRGRNPEALGAALRTVLHR